MNESWQMLAVTGVLGWIAWELRALRAELNKFVTKHDCEQDMAGHCRKLEELTAKVESNAEALAKLTGKAEAWHGKDKK